jgi:glycosyltransferase involved in cell wall biosynthesis
MKLAVVVQRYGVDISGGAELHARYIAEHLSRHAEVRVLATCARDYITWRNEFPEGEERVNGVPVERFRVVQERQAQDFGRRSRQVFHQKHSLQDELDWLDSEGPLSPGLIARLAASGGEFDFVLLFSMRYHQAYHGARVAASRAVLVPTAEREPSLGLAIFPPVLRGVRAIMYNSEEERALLQDIAHNHDVPSVVVGVGSEVPSDASGERARQTFGLLGPYIVYVGRIDANKGCPELFDFFTRYLFRSHRQLTLVLIGTPVVKVPGHPNIRHLGFVSDRDKFDVIAGSAALVMPSHFESLSIVALEAWALGRPVVANARCDVLAGQCLRSGGGLYYQNAAEFAGVLDAILDDEVLAADLGRRGRHYYERHYTWPVIERAYLDMLTRLSSEPRASSMEAIPGWLTRRRRDKPPAADVVDALPRGPVRPSERQVQP